MRKAAIIVSLALAGAGALTGCSDAAPDMAHFAPVYEGVDTRLMDGDLVNFRVAMRGARSGDDVSGYAECAAAQYALIRDYGFARHLRTNVTEQGGLWRGDAVYTISAQLPRGLRTIDAEVVVAQCAENGIPTV
jgi:hypothetical protein